MSQWGSAKARRVLAALLRIGWSIKAGSGWFTPHFVAPWLAGYRLRVS
jgi:hypothetical protein